MDQQEWKHPEQLAGEIFITNAQVSDFKSIGLKTKRKGCKVYDIHNKLMTGIDQNNMFPVFIQKSEIEERQND